MNSVRNFLLVQVILITFLSQIFGQDGVQIKNVVIVGKVINEITKEPLTGVSIILQNSSKGFVSGDSGRFKIVIPDKSYPIVLELTSLGFEKKVIRIKESELMPIISMVPQFTILQEVVYAASRTSESILKSPVSIEKFSQKQLKEAAGADLLESLRFMKGIELVNNGLTYKQVNARGFSGTMNSRFLTLADGVDIQSPVLGWSFGNQFGITDLDLESAELIPGAASALYGPIAFNGLLSFHSKDPFKYQGLNVQLKSGVNHINDPEAKAHGYNDYAIRFAKSYRDKFAFKLNASYNNGLDWFANNYTDFNAQTPISQRGPKNPARDAIHIYGDEVRKVLPGIGLVSRTGYEDKFLSDYNVYNAKLNASVHYRLNRNLTLIASQFFGQSNSNYNGSSRYSTKNISEYISKLEFKGENFFIRTYRVWENLGEFYNTRELAQVLNRSWVKDFSGNLVTSSMADQMWFMRYEAAYKGLVNGVVSDDHMIARSFADQNRLNPGTPEFETRKSDIIKTLVPAGARLFSNSSYYHSEGQYQMHNKLNTFNLIIGGNFRYFDIYSKETLLGERDNQRIQLTEYGLFAQATNKFIDDKLRITGSLRFDKNQNFKGNLTPRISMVYQTAKQGFLRASLQTGFRNPRVIDQYVMLRSGATILLGGAPIASRGMNVYENSFTSSSASNFTNAFNASIALGKTVQESINASIGLLKKANVPFISPEKQTAFEIGYKSEVNHKMTIDINIYYSMYKNFIVNTVVESVPSTILQSDGKINPIAANELADGKGQLYQLYTNSEVKVSAAGISGGFTYNMFNKFELRGNATYNQLNTKELDVNNYAAYNTPPWSTNLSFGNSDIFNGIGFNMNWHWQDSFLWYGTFLGNRPGSVKAFSLLDMQVNKKFSKKDIQVKMGGSNILNHKVAQIFGGPETGAIYYISILLGK